MVKLVQMPGTPPLFRSFDPVRFGGSSRLTFKRLRRPTPLPMIAIPVSVGSLLARIGGLFVR